MRIDTARGTRIIDNHYVSLLNILGDFEQLRAKFQTNLYQNNEEPTVLLGKRVYL